MRSPARRALRQAQGTLSAQGTLPAQGTAPATSLAHRITGWFAPELPAARVAILRTVVYVFVLIDIHAFVADPIPLSRHPELYAPLFLERVLHLPPPSPALTISLYVLLWLGCLVAAANRLPELAGFVVAAAFTWWTAIGMSYGKVDHDHLALLVALWVLPTVGPIAGRWRATERSNRAGWALKCVQIAVIATYFLSALTKIRSGGWSLTSWPQSAILMWAIVRRPHGLGQFLVPFPGLLRAMQWFAFVAELTSPIVLWLRGRALLGAAMFWLGFHVFTVSILYIHFAPTLVCWLAFVPLERLTPWLRRVVAGRPERARRRPTRASGAACERSPARGRGLADEPPTQGRMSVKVARRGPRRGSTRVHVTSATKQARRVGARGYTRLRGGADQRRGHRRRP